MALRFVPRAVHNALEGMNAPRVRWASRESTAMKVGALI